MKVTFICLISLQFKIATKSDLIVKSREPANYLDGGQSKALAKFKSKSLRQLVKGTWSLILKVV